MIRYLIRRTLYAIPILIGVNLITFVLFFVVNPPDNMARIHLGIKRVTPDAIAKWKHEHGYDKPVLWNAAAPGAGKMTDTIFFDKSLALFAFDFGRADDGRDIGADIGQRMWPSLAIALPLFAVGILINITFAMVLAFFRGSYLDLWGVVTCIILLSISTLFYVIGGQYLIGKLLNLTPISGYDTGLAAAKFLVLPVIVGIVSSVGASTRLYRTIFIEEINKDYIRTARAKGLSEVRVLFKHGLKNALIPILTGVVVIIPSLFLGSLILESFFGVPGLGSYTIDGIRSQDFGIVRAMVFLGSFLYIVGLILTDVSYTLVDPRVRLE
ncbi:MAG: ABC transporter permease [Nitrospirota bacterium]